VSSYGIEGDYSVFIEVVYSPKDKPVSVSEVILNLWGKLIPEQLPNLKAITQT
jgi:hypothetical protein